MRLRGISRILEDPDHVVWCCSPIRDECGRIHVFYSRWPTAIGFGGWLTACEVAHAVSDQPAGPYRVVDVALAPRPDCWDARSIHNPTIHKIGDTYALFYMGTMEVSEGRPAVAGKRIGLAMASSLNGPWLRFPDPIVEVGPSGTWDDLAVSNPAFLRHPSGEYWLYYKGWDYRSHAACHGNRKIGLAVASDPAGPYHKAAANPLIDFSPAGRETQCEDPYVWHDGMQFHMIMRDMGVFSHEAGLHVTSPDGKRWSKPRVAYTAASTYFDEDIPDLPRANRFERPQLLWTDHRPSHLFCAYRGGAYGTASGVVLAIDDPRS